MKRIAIYSRKSVFEETSNSTDNQIKIIQEYMKRYGDCQFYVFEDEGFSGGNTNRPDFQRMLNMVENKELDIVAVYKIDRIARNIVDFVNVYDLLQKNDVSLISVTEAFDLTTSMGKLIMMILATFAEMERDNTKQRVRDNKIQNAKIGQWTGGCDPLGYSIVEVQENGKTVKYLETKESEVEIVKEIYNKFIEEENLNQVSKYCYEKYGIFNTVASLKRFLKSTIYVKSNETILQYLGQTHEVYGEPNGNGILQYGSRSREKKKVEFYTVSKHKGIVDADIWLKIQYIIKSRYVAQKNWSNASFLSGLVICKNCGSKMWIYANRAIRSKNDYYSFICPNRKYNKTCNNKSVVTHGIETSVLEQFKQIEVNKEAFLEVATAVEYTKYTTDIKAKTKDIKKKENEIEKLTEKMIMLEGAALDIVIKKMNGLSGDIKKLKEDLFILEKHQSFNSNKKLDAEYIYNQIVSFNKIADKLTVVEKQNILNKIIKKITWDGLNKDVAIDV